MNIRLLLKLVIILIFYLKNAKTQYQSKEIDEKVQRLLDMSATMSIVPLNSSSFEELVRSFPKNYSLIVLFTAAPPAQDCNSCKYVYEEYKTLAYSVTFTQLDNKLFFGISKLVGLAVPVLMHFPPKGNPESSDTMNFEKSGIQAESMANWIRGRTGIQIQILRPEKHSNLKFETEYRTKRIEEKIQQLKEMSATKTILNLNRKSFKEFVRSSPRNYSFMVLFSAVLPPQDCYVCQHIHEEYEILAYSASFTQLDNKLFFGIAKLMRIEVPMLVHFPPKGDPESSDTMNFEKFGSSAESMANWFSRRTGIRIKIFRPVKYLIVVGFVTFAIFLCSARNYLDLLFYSGFWAAGAVCFCCAMVSGQMWNHIIGSPLYERNENGLVYIYNASNIQFVLESYFVALLNGAVTIGMILMIEAAGGVRSKEVLHVPKERKSSCCQALVGLVVICVFFSILLSIFESKQ